MIRFLYVEPLDIFRSINLSKLKSDAALAKLSARNLIKLDIAHSFDDAARVLKKAANEGHPINAVISGDNFINTPGGGSQIMDLRDLLHDKYPQVLFCVMHAPPFDGLQSKILHSTSPHFWVVSLNIGKNNIFNRRHFNLGAIIRHIIKGGIESSKKKRPDTFKCQGAQSHNHGIHP